MPQRFNLSDEKVNQDGLDFLARVSKRAVSSNANTLTYISVKSDIAWGMTSRLLSSPNCLDGVCT